MSAPLRYRIQAKNPEAHLYEVSITVDTPDPSGQVFELPAWIPGSYMIRDYAKHVVAIHAESDGLAVPMTKLDKSRWQAEPVDRPLKVVAEIYAYDSSVRGAHLDATHAYFNGPCVFLSVSGQEQSPCELEIVAPDPPVGKDWRVATSMRRDGADQYGFGSYRAEDYAELIDHPVEISELTIGEFDVRGIPHAIAIRGRVRVDIARLCHDLQRICEQHIDFLGAPDGLDRYLFLLHAPGTGYGGLEHRWSSSLVCSRDNLPLRADSELSDGYRMFLGLVSHEYFHLWNVKRLKPAVFTPYDLSSESYTGLLWVFEGITSYYDDLALLRAGLIPAEGYLELVGQTITRVMRGSGRHKQSVEESSFDAWTKFYKQDENAGNAIVSYYAKGSLIALALDLKIRSESSRVDTTTLDDVMKECWKRWGQSGEGMPEDGFESACAEVTGLDLGDFFDASVRGTGELPLQKLLAKFGINYCLRQASNAADKGGKPAEKQVGTWLGATLANNAEKSVFTAVANGGPAELAGVAPGDVAVALDGLVLTAANCAQRLKTYRDGDKLELIVFRGDELITSRIKLADAPETTCYLEFDSDADAESLARQAAWLLSD